MESSFSKKDWKSIFLNTIYVRNIPRANESNVLIIIFLFFNWILFFDKSSPNILWSINRHWINFKIEKWLILIKFVTQSTNQLQKING